MDSNEALRQLREWSIDPYNSTGEQAGTLGEEAAAELFQALDNWIMQGGFLPEDWDTAYTVGKDRR